MTPLPGLRVVLTQGVSSTGFVPEVPETLRGLRQAASLPASQLTSRTPSVAVFPTAWGNHGLPDPPVLAMGTHGAGGL